jgi:hypothetical protein
MREVLIHEEKRTYQDQQNTLEKVGSPSFQKYKSPDDLEESDFKQNGSDDNDSDSEKAGEDDEVFEPQKDAVFVERIDDSEYFDKFADLPLL